MFSIPLFSSMGSSRASLRGGFQRSIPDGDYGKSAIWRGLKHIVAVILIIIVDGEATKAGSSLLCRAADDASGTL